MVSFVGSPSISHRHTPSGNPSPGRSCSFGKVEQIAPGDLHQTLAPTSGGTALLYDHDHTAATYAVADLLAQRFRRVILMTTRPHIAQGVNYCSAIGVLRRLHRAGVEIVTAGQPLARAVPALACEFVSLRVSTSTTA